MIALLDCNNFYVSCERLFNPRLVGQPVVVLSNNDGCVISRSNEAKNLGIEMGVPLFKIKKILADNKIKVLSSNYSVYGDISNRIMSILKNDYFTEVEIYSIDEAFFSLNKISNREQRCLDLANKILKWTGIPVSIGIASTKTLAKITNRVIKKKHKYKELEFNHSNVLELKTKFNLEYVLRNTEVENIWGVGRRLSVFLKQNNINTAYDLRESNENFIREKKGVILHRTVLELRGMKCNYIERVVPAKKSICVSRSFGKKLSSYKDIRDALIVYTQKAASKMRENNLSCGSVTIFIKTSKYGKRNYANSKTHTLIEATIDLRLIWKVSDKLLKDIYRDKFIYSKVGIILSNLLNQESIQLSLVDDVRSKRTNEVERKLMKLIDKINNRFGYGKIKLSSDSSKDFFSNKNTINKKRISWEMRSKYRSPCYTTSWCDIPKAKV